MSNRSSIVLVVLDLDGAHAVEEGDGQSVRAEVLVVDHALADGHVLDAGAVVLRVELQQRHQVSLNSDTTRATTQIVATVIVAVYGCNHRKSGRSRDKALPNAALSESTISRSTDTLLCSWVH